MADDQSIDPIVPQFVEALTESMKDGLDLVTRDVLVAGTNLQYASIAATRGGASGVGSGIEHAPQESNPLRNTALNIWENLKLAA